MPFVIVARGVPPTSSPFHRLLQLANH